jgi:hypothetical protein
VGGWGGVTFDIAAGHFQHLDKIEAEYPPLEVLGCGGMRNRSSFAGMVDAAIPAPQILL